jgi:hypothetical protein
VTAFVSLFGIGFAAAQGGAIFLTAWLAKRVFKLESPWWQPLLMLLSYFAWIFATAICYTLLGGEWGMMDGGLMMVGLFTSAAVSALIFAVGWQAATYRWNKFNG